MYHVTLRNLAKDDERITLYTASRQEHAESARKRWRQVLGGKKSWVIDRRPGIDTLDDHLVLKIEHGANDV